MSRITSGLDRAGSSWLSHLGPLFRIGAIQSIPLHSSLLLKKIPSFRPASAHPCPRPHCQHTDLLLVSAFLLVMSFLPGAPILTVYPNPTYHLRPQKPPILHRVFSHHPRPSALSSLLRPLDNSLHKEPLFPAFWFCPSSLLEIGPMLFYY